MMNQMTIQIRKGGTAKTTKVLNIAQMLDEAGYGIFREATDDFYDNDTNQGE